MSETTQPIVTVYIPCRNYGRFLTQAIDSVFAQLYTNWELFLVDEGSDDNTVEICAHYRNRSPDRVRVIRNEKPYGLQRVANTVLQQCRGVYFIRLDADDWLDEGALLLLVAKLNANPTLGIVYGNYFYTDHQGNVLGMERRHEFGVEDKAGHLPPHGACTMVRTRALKAVGGYSEDIDAQDGWELWYKLTREISAASLNVPIFYYRQHEASLSRDTNRLLKARAKIFGSIAEKMEGSFKPSHLTVLGVKESYPGFSGVPYRDVDGEPLLQRGIKSVAEANSVSKVMISSKSKTVLEFSEKLEISGTVPEHDRHLRETFENGEYLPVHSILKDAGEEYFKKQGTYPDIISFCSLHTINRTADHIDSAVDILKVTKSDSVVSVQEEKAALFAYHKSGLNLINPGRLEGLSYDREKLYRFNGALIVAWWDVIADGGLLGQNIGYLEMSQQESIQFSSHK